MREIDATQCHRINEKKNQRNPKLVIASRLFGAIGQPWLWQEVVGLRGFRTALLCLDNACVEGFFGTPKRELMYHRHDATREDTTQDIFEYIEVFYNWQRRHSTLGYDSPAEYEARTAVA